ncbi:extracellular solute-binding protein [Auraticoccus cholistanensis]|uniref:extracellular solute-binding protein n=1 Tax=Auraticoccus cholistanensis TaxID=2656650 RepID=UPI0022B233B6|nr:extracellular solute-binding protein [Auraticoccus cholistanensis]
MWQQFYAGDPAADGRGGGFQWLEPNAEDPRVFESFEFLADLVREDLASSPAQGGGTELVSRFADGLIGMTPAGGYWVSGLAEGGMGDDEYDVTFFPRWRSQRHQFGAAGYAMMRTSQRKDAAWEWIKFCASREGMRLQFPEPNTTPVRRSMLTEDFYADAGPRHWQVFYDTLDQFSDTAPIPAPPQQAAVETALVKNVVNAINGDTGTALATLQRDLELALRRTA